jgi:hypothetical protein
VRRAWAGLSPGYEDGFWAVVESVKWGDRESGTFISGGAID